jgi:NADH dehydrogenase (ubiquinone) Fe-S protein 4
MLQRAAQRLVLQPQGMLQAACYSTKMPDDYSLVMKNTQKELASHSATPEKEIGLCAGVPLETFTRKARIYSPSRTAGQQGMGNTFNNKNTRAWRIVFDTQEKWINPLMGWTSTSDPLENVGRSTLLFHTKEEAIAFCQKHGWEAQVDDPEQRRTDRQKRFTGYGDNFSIKRNGLPDMTFYGDYGSVQKTHAPKASSAKAAKQ